MIFTFIFLWTLKRHFQKHIGIPDKKQDFYIFQIKRGVKCKIDSLGFIETFSSEV